MRRAIYLFLGVTGFLLIYYVIARTIRARHKFPIPGFLVELIDNPLRRRFVQLPGETPPRHVGEGGKVIDFRRSKFIWRLMKFLNRFIVHKVVPRSRLDRLVLILTTTGRKSGLSRKTPLQYEEIDGAYYAGSARGPNADWFRNIVANPNVRLQIGARHFDAIAEPVTDPARIADFLDVRLRRRPRMMGMMLRAEGLSAKPDRAQLEAFASDLAMVVLRPSEAEDD